MSNYQQADSQAIAIIGMACRFPGANDPAAFWQNLVDHRENVIEIPSDRWDWRSFDGDPRQQENKTNSRWGGFISDIDKFDPLFFSMSPMEANFIDPQHRIFLQTVWHAIENAGYSPRELVGSKTGVYAGVSKNDYAELMGEQLAAFVSTGTVHSILVNRVSYLLDLHGPSMPIDTACSSSLVAFHLAVKDLQAGECDAAIVGGVNALLSPRMYVSHAKSGMLSPVGRCRTFSAAADGYVRGEGVGVLLLKRLGTAIRDGDQIVGLVRATAINHGGKANFLTAPSVAAQASVVSDALARARLDPRQIGYIEAHGTGTPIGDPIEIEGLKKAFRGRAQLQGIELPNGYCGLSAVKTNIGHLESAAGMAAIIKVLLSMRHRQIAPVSHVETLNPHLMLDESPFYVVQQLADWPAPTIDDQAMPRCAGASSFGMGGVNAHVILQEPNESVAGHRTPIGPTAFEGRRCWFPGRTARVGGTPLRPEAAAPVMPECQTTAAVSLAGAISTADSICKFDLDAAQPMIADHRVAGLPLLPAVGYLDLLRTFLSERNPSAESVFSFTDIYWLRPMRFDQGDSASLNLVCRASDQCFVFSSAGAEHCRGYWRVGPDRLLVDPVSVDAGSKTGAQTLTSEAFYALLAEHGLQDGASFRTVASFQWGGDVAVASLHAASHDSSTAGITDAALQVAAVLSILNGSADRIQYVPFHAAEVTLAQDPAAIRSIVVTQHRQHGADETLLFDIDCLNERRQILMQWRKFAKRALATKSSSPGITPSLEIRAALACYTGRWEDTTVAPELKPTGLLVVVEDVALSGAKAAAADHLQFSWQGQAPVVRLSLENLMDKSVADTLLQSAGMTWQSISHVLWMTSRTDGSDIENLVRLCQALIGAKLHQPLRIVYINAPAMPQYPEESQVWVLAAAGLARTLRIEHPSMDLQVHWFDAEAAIFSQTVELALRASTAPLHESSWQATGCQRRVMRAVQPMMAAALPLPSSAVVLMTGGAGGLGLVFAARLAREHGAHIVMMGRRALDAGIESSLQEVRRNQGSAQYVQVDVADDQALRSAVDAVRDQHGRIDAVIHASGIKEDGFIFRKSPDSFARVLSPKAAGVVHLDRATAADALAFFMACSSVAALMPNQGQCDYATANSFLDHFMQLRQQRVLAGQRQGTSVAINWPLWANGGMRVAEHDERHLLEEFGMRPLDSETGAGFLAQALAMATRDGLSQILCIAGDQQKIAAHLRLSEHSGEPHAAKQKPEDRFLDDLLRMLRETTGRPVPSGDPSFQEVGLDSIAATRMTQLLRANYAINLAPMIFFECRTLLQLHRRLLDEFGSVILSATRPANQAKTLFNDLIDLPASGASVGRFSKRFDTTEFYLRDHVVDGLYNMPGACYLEMARQAADLARPESMLSRMTHTYWSRQFSSAGEPFTAYVRLLPDGASGQSYHYEIVDLPGDQPCVPYATGSIEYLPAGAVPASLGQIDLDAIRARCRDTWSRDQVYQHIHAEGLMVGSSFMPLQSIHLWQDEAIAVLELPDEVKHTASGYLLHPSLLTGAFQVALVSNRHMNSEGAPQSFIPMAIGTVRYVDSIPARCLVHAKIDASTRSMPDMLTFTIKICDPSGKVLAQLDEFTIKARQGRSDVTKASVRGAVARSAGAIDGPEALANVDAALARSTRDLLRNILARAVGLEAVEIEDAVAFESYGINSMMIQQLNGAMAEVFGNQLSRTLFFQYRNLQDLADYFLQQHRDQLIGRFGTAAGPTATSPMPALHRGGADARLPATVTQQITMDDRQRADEPIAVIGMAGRYPMADDLDAFWDNLRAGKDCIEEIPPDRFDIRSAGIQDETGALRGKWGGFLSRVDDFDPEFFEISPREAELIDPQERLFLQVAWHAMENAGYTRQSLASDTVGVFVGALWQPYQELAVLANAAGQPVSPSALLYSIANRVSYFCNFHGPSMAVDTACSGSLTALHLACQSLRTRESSVAIAGGVNLSIGAGKYQFLSRHQFLSTDGRCRSFGEGGSGYVPGEGVGAVLLKRLADAERDGDRILGVIAATALSHGGRTHGYTVPNPNLQGSMIASALAAAGLDSRVITYIEAHGTGTPLGDPIEIEGLMQAYRRAPDDIGSCAIGSVKSNIGHLEASAGIAGLTKVLLQLQYGQLAPSLHSTTLNANIDFERTPFRVPQALEPWTPALVNGRVQARVAGISSFGAGGANAHAIVAEYMPAAQPESPTAVDRTQLIVLSARSGRQLQEIGRQLQALLQRPKADHNLISLAYTLQVGREAFEERVAFLVQDVAGLVEVISAWLSGVAAPRCIVREPGAGRALLGDADDLQALMQRWIERQDVARIAHAWVNGVSVPWLLLHGKQTPRRLALPGYPFVRDRYWLPVGEDLSSSHVAMTPAASHPMIQSGSARGANWQFHSSLDTRHFFLADHCVGNRPVLSGAASLELIRAACGQAFATGPMSPHIVFKDVVWQRPLLATGGKLELELTLVPVADGQYSFAVQRDPGGEESNCLHGVVDICDTDAQPDGAHALPVFPGGDPSFAAAEIYRRFASMGLNYGLSHQAITAAHVLPDQIWLRIRLPESVRAGASAFALHPSLLDAVFQGTLLFDEVGVDVPWLPSNMHSMQVWGAFADDMLVCIRRSKIEVEPAHAYALGLDLNVWDAAGVRCIASVAGLTIRPGIAVRDQLPGEITLIPVWEATAPAAKPDQQVLQQSDSKVWLVSDVSDSRWRGQVDRRVVTHAGDSVEWLSQSLQEMQPQDRLVWCAPPHDASGETMQWVQRQHDGLLRLFRLVKALLPRRTGVRLTIMTRSALPVSAVHAINLAEAALPGFIGSLAKERAAWEVTHVDLDQEFASEALPTLSDLLALPPSPGGDAWVMRSGRWLRRQWVPLISEGTTRPSSAYDPESKGVSPYRRQGVYIVIGGAGGIGAAWSESVAREYQAQVIWLGRRPIDASIQQKIDTVARVGPAPVYMSLDAGLPGMLRDACNTIEARFGPVHGLIHAALVLSDRSLVNMDEESLRAAVAPKVDAGAWLADVAAQLAPDFVLFLSSITALMTPAGQSNYAAGSTFVDALAHHLDRQLPCRVRVIDWGYWGSVGVVATPEYRRRMAKFGFDSIEPADGMKVIRQALGEPLVQRAYARTTSTLPIASLSGNMLATAFAPLSLGQQSLNVLDGTSASLPAPDTNGASLRMHQAEPLIASLLQLQLQLMLAGVDASARDLLAVQRRWPELPPYLHRWLVQAASWPMMARNTGSAGQRSDLLAQTWKQWEAFKAEFAADAAMMAHLNLAQAALLGLPALLAGQTNATSILFPGGSSAMVEAVYADSAASTYFHQSLAIAAAVLVKDRLANEPYARIRILEIGAGTGATTRHVLDALEPFAPQLDEYAFTDVSPAFLNQARERFHSRHPGLRFEVFNAQHDPAAQGIDLGAYDLVIAANVLHATRNIRQSVRHAKALLRAGGCLLINEISAHSLFLHLTFGLLEGWWLFEDEALRLPGGPGLSAQGWREVLALEGFLDTRFLTPDSASALGQQVVAAISDGIALRSVAASNSLAVVARDEAEQKDEPIAGSPRDRVIAWLKRVMAQVTKTSLERIREESDFARYGLDSLLQAQVIRKLEDRVGQLPATLLFERSNLNELTDYLMEHHADALVESTADVSPQPLSAAQRASESSADAPETATRSTQSGQTPSLPDNVPIAIIGLHGVFPDCDSAAKLWQHLIVGANLITAPPSDRWPDFAGRERLYGGYLQDINRFDAQLFGIDAAEVWTLPPELRLCLESGFAAFEQAGYGLKSLRQMAQAGASVGVFLGSMYQQYAHLLTSAGQDAIRSNWTDWELANRVSHSLHLTGPSLAINTACSSALTAIHLACESLRMGSCQMALAGGVNLTLDPSKFASLAQHGLLGSTSESRSFGQGDGFLPGEGVGMVVLKTLAQAQRDGDRIDALILATGINHAGGRQSYLSPEPRQQTRLIADTIGRAGIPVDTITCVESAANGSPLGDALEFNALDRAFVQSTAKQAYCRIGSIKSNMGHLEAASGVSQLAKMVLQMQQKMFVPSIHATPINPAIRMSGTPFALSDAVRPWTALVDPGTSTPIPRRGLINSFGAGGAYAVAVIQEAPLPPLVGKPVSPGIPSRGEVLLLSAVSARSLAAQAKAMAEYLLLHPQDRLEDVACTLARRNHNLPVRLAIVADSVANAIQRLRRASVGKHAEISDRDPRVQQLRAWLCAGTDDPGVPAGSGNILPLPGYVFDHRELFEIKGATYWAKSAAPSEKAAMVDADVFLARVRDAVARGELGEDAFLALITGQVEG
jgi:acyl transferase domain-containing protein/acyl carrier protein/SAM-dependent methyltransferase